MSSHTHTLTQDRGYVCVCVSFWTDYSVCALQKSKKQQRRILCVFFFIFWIFYSERRHLCMCSSFSSAHFLANCNAFLSRSLIQTQEHTDKQRIWRHLVEPLLLFCFCFWFFSAFVWITYVCVCGSFLCFVVWFWLGHWTACSLPKNKKLQSQFERRREFFAGIRPIAVEIGWNRALRGFEGEVFAQK